MVQNSKIIKYFFPKLSHTHLGVVKVLHRRRGAQKIFFKNCPNSPICPQRFLKY